MACIFGSDQTHFAQDAEGAKSNIFKVANWGRNNVESAHIAYRPSVIANC
jgi:hypothetical protein